MKVLVTNACATVRRQIRECGLTDVLQQPEETLVDLHAAVLWAQDHIKIVESSRVVIGMGANRRSSAQTAD